MSTAIQKNNFQYKNGSILNTTIPGFIHSDSLTLKKKHPSFICDDKKETIPNSPSSPMLSLNSTSNIIMFKSFKASGKSKLVSCLFSSNSGFKYLFENNPIQYIISNKREEDDFSKDNTKIINYINNLYKKQIEKRSLVNIPDINITESFAKSLSIEETCVPYTFIDTVEFGNQNTDLVTLKLYYFLNEYSDFLLIL